MLKIRVSTKFSRDFKRVIKRGLSEKKLQKVISILASEQKLPPKYRDHALTNSKEYKNLRECHIEPDWLLIYRIEDDTLTLYLARTGSHSDLFK